MQIECNNNNNVTYTFVIIKRNDNDLLKAI